MSPDCLTTATRFGYNNWPSRFPHSPNWNLNRPSLSNIWIRWLFVSATMISFWALTATPKSNKNKMKKSIKTSSSSIAAQLSHCIALLWVNVILCFALLQCNPMLCTLLQCFCKAILCTWRFSELAFHHTEFTKFAMINHFLSFNLRFYR